MKKNKQKKVKWHIKWRAFFVFVMIIAFLASFVYYISNLHIQHIYISGNYYVKDYEIIEVAGLKTYPKMIKYTTSTMEKNISTLDLINKVEVKKNLFGKVSIFVEEAHVLFYNRNNSTYVLSNGTETVKGNYEGIPFLINYVKSDVYERLVKELAKVKKESLALVSEIEYSPSKSGDIILDDTRFLLRMNDGNEVYINLVNIDRLDMYALSYTTLTQKGILYLDSDNGGAWFQNKESIE